MFGLYKLPVEVVILVIGHLEIGDLAAFAQTSRKFFEIADPELYHFAKDAVNSKLSWHPLRWAAEHGRVGTLRKAMAAGIDPGMTFEDEYDLLIRDQRASQIRFEAIGGKTNPDQPAHGKTVQDQTATDTHDDEWSPENDGADEIWLEQRAMSDAGFPGETESAIDFPEDDDDFDVGTPTSLGRSPSEDFDEDDESFMNFIPNRPIVSRRFCAIHLAAIGGHDGVIQFLLDHGVNIEACCREICGCQLVSSRSVGEMGTEAPVRPALWDKTALHLAICHFQKSTVRLLLARGALSCLSDPARPTTALHSAAATGQTDLCQHLIDHGYVQHVDVLDTNQLSPFYLAYFNGHWDTTVPFLLDRGANIDIEIPRDPANLAATEPNRSCTVLYDAIDRERFGDAIRLIQLGADVRKGLYSNAEHAEREETPLHAACRPAVRMFDEPRQDVPLKLSSPSNEEVLRTKLIQSLLQAGAEIDARTPGADGSTPLHYAAQSKAAPVLETLLSAGADVHIRGDEGRTALMYACLPPWTRRGYDVEVEVDLHFIRLLLDRGSRINTTDDWGNTVLHLVCDVASRFEGSSDRVAGIVRLLLDRGAREQARCHLGKTPLQAAFENGDLRICDILVRRWEGIQVMSREELHALLAFTIQYRPSDPEACHFLYDLDATGSLWESSTHLMQMFEAGCPQLAWDYLRRRMPPLNVKEKSIILHAAIQSGTFSVMRKMIAIKAPVNLPDKHGHTPLYNLLGWHGRTDLVPLVKDLLAAGADPHFENNKPPLRSAVLTCSCTLVDLMLLHSPLRNNARAPKGVYLHAAARSDPSTCIVRTLVRAGAEVTEMDVNGDTPLAVFLKNLDDQIRWTSHIEWRADDVCMMIWYLWNEDIDIVRRNKAGKSILSYLAALRLYDGKSPARARMAEALQRRVRLDWLPGGKSRPTLQFSSWFAKADATAP